EMHMTIYSYILKRKIKEAKQMLKLNTSISEISLLLGFTDAAHLSKVFKKHTGISPKQYKHLKNKKN
ncbi:helix-turn-helix domain-containing protein, partial [Enterococcus faecalis]|nr:helix-turn-helix domain-containing protein [Enterococcus faecalis]